MGAFQAPQTFTDQFRARGQLFPALADRRKQRQLAVRWRAADGGDGGR